MWLFPAQSNPDIHVHIVLPCMWMEVTSEPLCVCCAVQVRAAVMEGLLCTALSALGRLQRATTSGNAGKKEGSCSVRAGITGLFSVLP